MFDPGSIFYPPWLASAFALALAWLVFDQRYGWREALRRLFDRDIWLARSSRTDLLFSVVNVVLLRAPLAAVDSAVFLATLAATRRLLTALTGEGGGLSLPLPLEALLATAATMLAIDFASYAVHRAMHRVPWLWRVHALHHSAETLTPLTTYRQNPLEPFLLQAARAAAAGMALALLHRILPQATPVVTVLGMGAGFFAYMLTVNLHHAPVPVHYPRWVRRVLVSPHLHHLHHSADPRHHDRNFGVVLSLWDRLFGTLHDERVAPGALRFGITSPRPSPTSALPPWEPLPPPLAPR